MNKYVIIWWAVIILLVAGLYLALRDKSDSAESEPIVSDTASIIKDTKEDTKEVTEPIKKEMTKEIISATLHTNKGEITIEFLTEQAPKTVVNFQKLAGENFYNGVKFHRVIKGFMIQGGDPLTKDGSKMNAWGTGGPGYKFLVGLGPKNKNDVGTGA